VSIGSLASAPYNELIILAVLVSLSGAVAGVVAGMLGVGGGIVLVPVLFQAFSFLGIDEALRMPLAVGTSLATIIPTSIRSTISHHEHGSVDWPLLKAWSIPTIAGVLIGAWIASIIGGHGLKAVFAAGAGLFGLFMLIGSEDWRLANRVPTGWAIWPLGLANGGLSVLMGIGGGTFGVTILTLYGLTMHRAVATAAGFGAIIAIPGALGMIVNGWSASGLPPMSLGYVNLIGVALIVPATLLSTPVGVRIAHNLSRSALRKTFGLFLCLTALRMGWAYLG
jgi:uncharacterized membrane protein YfcA